MSCLDPHPITGFSGAPQGGLSVGGCADALVATSGLCCTQGTLDALDASLGQDELLYTASCFLTLRRFDCALRCSPELPQWWDATIGRAHLCDDFCSDLWDHCYASGAASAAAPYRTKFEFCEFNTGAARANATSSASCLRSLTLNN